VQNTIKFSREGGRNKLIIQPSPLQNKKQLLLESAKEKYLGNDSTDMVDVYDIVGRNLT